jgi:hypothetical protein
LLFVCAGCCLPLHCVLLFVCAGCALHEHTTACLAAVTSCLVNPRDGSYGVGVLYVVSYLLRT